MGEASYFMQDRDDIKPSRDKEAGRYPKKVKMFKPDGQTWLNYKGTFSMDMLYKLMYETLKSMGFSDQDGSKDKIEHYYSEKRSPDGVKGEVWFWWRTIRPGDVIKSEQFDYILNVDVQILGLKDTTITMDGNKFKMNYGEISIFIKPYLNMKFKEDSYKGVMKPLMSWWENRLYASQIQQRKTEIYKDVNLFYAIIKQFLQLENFTKISSEFYPNKGVPTYKL